MPRRLTPADRALAWIVTGPLGHLWSVVADVAVLWTRYGWNRLRAARRGG